MIRLNLFYHEYADGSVGCAVTSSHALNGERRFHISGSVKDTDDREACFALADRVLRRADALIDVLGVIHPSESFERVGDLQLGVVPLGVKIKRFAAVAARRA